MSSSNEGPGVRVIARIVVLLTGVMLTVFMSANRAAAHAELIGSQPANGATVAQSPRVVLLSFSEEISPEFRSARLVDRDGHTVTGTRVAAGRGDPRLVRLELPQLSEGAYGVIWRVLAEDDGHTRSGVVVFTVGGTAAAPAFAADGGTATRPLDVARRWLSLCLLAGLVGGLAVAGLVLGRAGATATGEPLVLAIRSARRRILTFAAACAALGAVAGVANTVEQARALTTAATGGSQVTHLLAATRWGHLWLVREVALIALAVLVVAGAALLSARRRGGLVDAIPPTPAADTVLADTVLADTVLADTVSERHR